VIVDSSALVAMLRGEPEAARFGEEISRTREPVLSAGNYLETSIVIDRDRDAILSAKLDALLNELKIEVVPVTPSQARIARQAYRDFGKGSGHPAKLNFGDCFAYALAVERGEPLLYKGDDFAHAGLTRVV
jgi:ribonuclease VapC